MKNFYFKSKIIEPDKNDKDQYFVYVKILSKPKEIELSNDKVKKVTEPKKIYHTHQIFC